MLKTLYFKLSRRFPIHVIGMVALLLPQVSRATDSYRWLHVTIDTPWAIFIFLLPMVLLPVVLMAYLYWRFAGREETNNKSRGRQAVTEDKAEPRPSSPE